MAMDQHGKFRLNNLRPIDGKLPMGKLPPKEGMGGSFAGKGKPTPKGTIGGEHGDGESASEGGHIHVKDNGDGSFTSEHEDGTKVDHEDIHHAAAHMMHHHMPMMKHHIASHGDMESKSHGIHESGEHDGTHDHANLDELKSSMGNFLDEEGHEGDGEESGGEGEGAGGVGEYMG